MGIAELAAEHERIIVPLCEQLESEQLSPRMRRRLSWAFARAVEKAFAIGWTKDELLEKRGEVDARVLRHAERGAREYDSRA